MPTKRSPNSARARREVLSQLCEAAGVAWARSYRDAVHRDGRRAAGGFPGTLTEAREQFARLVEPQLQRLGTLRTTYEECEDGVRLLYSTARNEWLTRRDDDSA